MLWLKIRCHQTFIVYISTNCKYTPTLTYCVNFHWGDESDNAPTKAQENDSTKSSFVKQWA